MYTVSNIAQSITRLNLRFEEALSWNKTHMMPNHSLVLI